MIITIQGTAGSGKGTVAKKIAKQLRYDYYSVGDHRRTKAAELGMTIEQYNKLGETDPSTDLEADEWQKQLGLTKNNFVIDCRTGFVFIPKSLKVYLTVDADVAAKRIYADQTSHNSNRINETHAHSLAEQKKLTHTRDDSDKMRYKKWYGLEDIADPKHYDIYLNTSSMKVNEVVDTILTYARKNHYVKPLNLAYWRSLPIFIK
jgi:predicted cytidylate kinase